MIRHRFIFLPSNCPYFLLHRLEMTTHEKVSQVFFASRLPNK